MIDEKLGAYNAEHRSKSLMEMHLDKKGWKKASVDQKAVDAGKPAVRRRFDPDFDLEISRMKPMGKQDIRDSTTTLANALASSSVKGQAVPAVPLARGPGIGACRSGGMEPAHGPYVQCMPTRRWGTANRSALPVDTGMMLQPPMHACNRRTYLFTVPVQDLALVKGASSASGKSDSK